ncbi:hypothetical protein [Trinickia terrae]|uniref:hypothetical protein n=1 Tax=Trinickia terrae TaxID=2571161 RepID=UPI00146DAA8A|nr:hypothetical protein [Trinickia terrae]
MGRNYERPIHSPLEILPGLYKAKVMKGQPNPDKLRGLFEKAMRNGRDNAYKSCGFDGFFVVPDPFWRHSPGATVKLRAARAGCTEWYIGPHRAGGGDRSQLDDE